MPTVEGVRSIRVIKWVRKTLFLLLIGSLLGYGCEKADSRKLNPLLTIIHTNDIHGSVSPIGGLAQVATYIKNYKAQHPDEKVIVVDAGDKNRRNVYDDMTCGRLMFEVAAEVGYDYLAIGNHELNYGYRHFLNNLDSLSRGKTLNANIRLTDSDEYLVNPFDILMVNGVKIGIFSVVNDTPKLYNYPDLSALRVTDPIQETWTVLERLRQEKVDITIALVHLGILQQQTTGAYGYDDYQTIEGIDLIIDGHEHYTCPADANACDYRKPLLVRNEGYLRNGIGITKLWYQNGSLSISEQRVSKAELNGGSEEVLNSELLDPQVMKVYNNTTDKYNRIVGYNTWIQPLKTSVKAERRIGNTFCPRRFPAWVGTEDGVLLFGRTTALETPPD